MRYLITMTVDVEEVREKRSKPERIPPAVPEEKKPPVSLPIDQFAYGIKEAASALGISRTSMYYLIKEGKLKVVKLGRRTLIPVQELKSLLETVHT